MISQISGTLISRELDRVEIMTAGGLAYECLIPLSVYEGLPAEGKSVTLFTHLSVREDAWQLFGFSHAYERAVFQKLLVAKGVGPSLALGILSALTPERVVRALRETGYAGFCAVEPFDYHPDGPTAAARAIGYLQGVLESLS
jgi:Holliday junction DNA helicase RuvA